MLRAAAESNLLNAAQKTQGYSAQGGIALTKVTKPSREAEEIFPSVDSIVGNHLQSKSVSSDVYTLANPSEEPTIAPTFAPSFKPSAKPSISLAPSKVPTSRPTLPTAINVIDGNDMYGDFYALSADPTGQYIAAVDGYNGIYYSSNYGQSYSWNASNQVAPSGSFGFYYDVALASSVPQNVITATGTGIFYSTDSGRNLQKSSAPAGSWSFITLSSTGQYAYAAMTSSSSLLYTSTNYMKSFSSLNSSYAGPYVDLTASSSGQYVFALAYNALYISSNFGSTWSKTAPGDASYAYYSVSCSSTGQYVAVISNPAGGFLSSDYGNTWSTLAISAIITWNTISVSETGQYMVVTNNGASIFLSTNYGVTFTETTSGSQNYWKAASISSNGQYVYAAVSSNGYVYRSTNNGVTWAPTYYTWTSIATSQSGQYSVAVTGKTAEGSVFMSSTYGTTWTQIGFNTNMNYLSVACDANCQYIGIVPANSDYVLLSSNAGKSWVTSTVGDNVVNMAISSTGQYQVAVTGTISSTGYVYVSKDFGVTWTNATSCPTAAWASVTISANGQNMVAGSTNSLTGVYAYYSQDYGVTWFPSSGLKGYAASLASDATGQYLTSSLSVLYRSSDFGQTWAYVKAVDTSNAYVLSLASSANGTIRYAAGGNTLYTSTDYGATWTSSNNPTVHTYSSVACDATGQYVTLTTNPGSIYLSSNYGTTFAAQPATISTVNAALDIDSDDSSSDPVLSTGAIIGIAVGGFAALVIIVALCYMYFSGGLFSSSASSAAAAQSSFPEVTNPVQN